MEVECSSTASSRSFCAHQGVTAYPSLILFDGETKRKYEGGDRSVAGMHEFFLINLSEERFRNMLAPEEQEEGEQATADAASTNQQQHRDEL